MIIVCAWCTNEIGVKEPLEDSSVTDSICEDCYILEKEKLDQMHFEERYLKMSSCYCYRCTYNWYARSEHRKPICCPKCKSPYWKTPRKKKIETESRDNRRNPFLSDLPDLPSDINSGEKETKGKV